MKYSLYLFAVLISTNLFIVDAKRKAHESSKKFEGDFEFADENEKSSQQRKASLSERKKWIHDPSNDLCKPLNCKKKELCLLEDAFTAVCVSKKELHRNKDEVLTRNKFLEEEAKRKADTQDNNEQQKEVQQDDFYDFDTKENYCKSCPALKPSFLCGSDNKTYSSVCRLDYHNCLHATQIRLMCNGFCPCRGHQAKSNQAKKPEIIDNFSNNGENSTVPKFGFAPEEIKYDNKHYKYMKFTASNKNKEQKMNKTQRMLYNEMLEKQQAFETSENETKQFSFKSFECKQQQLTAIGNRLLDWFSVIMADSKKRRQHFQKSKARFSPLCKTEAKWMFGHLDINSDGYLSMQELYDLEHDQNEKCIKPFIDICDVDQNSIISSREWCNCFEKTDRPCIAVRRRLNGDLAGSYAPECDAQGFYKLTQCHQSVGVCWCVDKHGVEFANTRTREYPDCENVMNNAAGTIVATSDDEDEGDESFEEGSADRLLVF